MKPVVSIGTQDFEFIRSNHYFYVDKTSLIKEWWENADAVAAMSLHRLAICMNRYYGKKVIILLDE